MAIKGLTDRSLSFPIIGLIKKGSKKTSETKPGKDLDYFRVEFDSEEVGAEKVFKTVYGEKPKYINIILPFNDIDKMFSANMEAYLAGGMVARGNGEFFEYLIDHNSGEQIVKNWKDVKTGEKVTYREVVGTYKTQKGKILELKMKPVMRLKVIIPELKRAAYLQVLSTSYHDIANISSQLRAFHTLNGGQIAGIPFILRRRKTKVSVPIKGKKVRMEKSLLSIEANKDWVAKMLSKLSEVELALPEPKSGPIAQPDIRPIEEIPETIEEIEEDIPDVVDAVFQSDGEGNIEVDEEDITEIPY